MSKSSTETKPDLDIPVLVGIGEIAKLVPRAPQTVYRWRLPRDGKPPELPPPFAICSRTPLWRLEAVQRFAEEKGIELDPKVLKQITKHQGR